MNAPLNAEAVRAMQIAEWQAVADLTGQTRAQVAVKAMAARFTGRKVLTAAGAWMNLSQRTRDILVIYATKRDHADRLRWDSLTEDERFAVGAMARTLLKELNANARALRA